MLLTRAVLFAVCMVPGNVVVGNWLARVPYILWKAGHHCFCLFLVHGFYIIRPIPCSNRVPGFRALRVDTCWITLQIILCSLLINSPLCLRHPPLWQPSPRPACRRTRGAQRISRRYGDNACGIICCSERRTCWHVWSCWLVRRRGVRGSDREGG
jgi:hypothetical protein